MKGKKLAKPLVLSPFLAFSLILTNVPSLPSAKAATFKVEIVDSENNGVSNRALGIGDDPGEYYSKVTSGTATSVTWTSSKPEIASVSGGTVQALKQGVATITVTAKNSSETATDTLLISSVKNLPETPNSIISANSADVYAAATTDSDFRVASPLKSKVKIMAECADYYRVTLPEGTGATVKTGFILKSTVKIPAQSVELDKSDLVVAAGDSENLASSFLESYANDVNYSWSSSNSEIATVSGTSASTSVAGKKEGTADVALHALGSQGDDVSDSAKVYVWAKLANSEAYVKKATPLLGLPRVGSSSVANLSKEQKVKVTGHSGAFFRIAANGKNGFIAKTDLKVPSTSLKIKTKYTNVQIGQPTNITASFLPGYANDIAWNWSSGNKKIASTASTSSKAAIKGQKEGVTEIKTTAKGSNGTKAATGTLISTWTKTKETAAVISKSTKLLVAAKNGVESLGTIKKGAKVRILGKSTKFYYVSVENPNSVGTLGESGGSGGAKIAAITGFLPIASAPAPVFSVTVPKKYYNIALGSKNPLSITATVSLVPNTEIKKNGIIWTISNPKVATLKALEKNNKIVQITSSKESIINAKIFVTNTLNETKAASTTVTVWSDKTFFHATANKKQLILPAPGAPKGDKVSEIKKKGDIVEVLGSYGKDQYFVKYDKRTGFINKNGVEQIKLKAFTFATDDFSLYYGQKYSIKIKNVKPIGASIIDLIWKSSNPKIATVDEKGNVTAKKKSGKVKITASSKSGGKLSHTINIEVGNLFSLVMEKYNLNGVTVRFSPKQNTKIHHYKTICSPDGKNWDNPLKDFNKPKKDKKDIIFTIGSCATKTGKSAFYKVIAFGAADEGTPKNRKNVVIESNVVSYSFSKININTKDMNPLSNVLQNRNIEEETDQKGEAAYDTWEGATITTKTGDQYTFDSYFSPVLGAQSFARIGNSFFTFVDKELKKGNKLAETGKGTLSEYRQNKKAKYNDQNQRKPDKTNNSIYLYGAHGQTLSTDGKYLYLYLENNLEKDKLKKKTQKSPINHILKIDPKTLKTVADYRFSIKLDSKNDCVPNNFTMIDSNKFVLLAQKNTETESKCLLPNITKENNPAHLFFTGTLDSRASNIKLLSNSFGNKIGHGMQGISFDRRTHKEGEKNIKNDDLYFLTDGIFAKIKLNLLENGKPAVDDLKYTYFDTHPITKDKKGKPTNYDTQEFESLEFLENGSIFLMSVRHPEILGTLKVVSISSSKKVKGKYIKNKTVEVNQGNKLTASINLKDTDFKPAKVSPKITYRWFIDNQFVVGATKADFVIPEKYAKEVVKIDNKTKKKATIKTVENSKGKKVYVEVKVKTNKKINGKDKYATRKSEWYIIK